MKLTKWLGALTLVALSWSAHADGGLTVINADAKAYVLVVEDALEKTWEVQVDASATVSNICSNCYVSIKGQEDFEYADATTVIRIVDGKLQVQGQE